MTGCGMTGCGMSGCGMSGCGMTGDRKDLVEQKQAQA